MRGPEPPVAPLAIQQREIHAGLVLVALLPYGSTSREAIPGGHPCTPLTPRPRTHNHHNHHHHCHHNCYHNYDHNHVHNRKSIPGNFVLHVKIIGHLLSSISCLTADKKPCSSSKHTSASSNNMTVFSCERYVYECQLDEHGHALHPGWMGLGTTERNFRRTCHQEALHHINVHARGDARGGGREADEDSQRVPLTLATVLHEQGATPAPQGRVSRSMPPNRTIALPAGSSSQGSLAQYPPSWAASPRRFVDRAPNPAKRKRAHIPCRGRGSERLIGYRMVQPVPSIMSFG